MGAASVAKFPYRVDLPTDLSYGLGLSRISPLELSIGVSEETLQQAERNMRELLAEAWHAKEWDRFVLIHIRADRWRALKMVSGPMGVIRDFAVLFHDVWTDSEDIYRERRVMREMLRLIRAAGLERHLFTDKDYEAFKSMPDALTVYRGAKHWNRYGMSWTTNVHRAVFFATHNNHDGMACSLSIKDYGFIMEKTIAKTDVLFYSDERDEEEIILPHFQKGPLSRGYCGLLKTAGLMPSSPNLSGARDFYPRNWLGWLQALWR